jgi:hypothetical protein
MDSCCAHLILCWRANSSHSRKSKTWPVRILATSLQHGTGITLHGYLYSLHINRGPCAPPYLWHIDELKREYRYSLHISVSNQVDPHHFNVDPSFITLMRISNAAPHQRDVNLRPMVYTPSMASFWASEDPAFLLYCGSGFGSGFPKNFGSGFATLTVIQNNRVLKILVCPHLPPCIYSHHLCNTEQLRTM